VTFNHVIYIPMMLFVGGFLGFIVGARAARNAYDLQRRRDEDRDRAKAERAARKAAKKVAGAGDD
jgi:hypothetical protein